MYIIYLVFFANETNENSSSKFYQKVCTYVIKNIQNSKPFKGKQNNNPQNSFSQENMIWQVATFAYAKEFMKIIF
jgi:hypothetical protein